MKCERLGTSLIVTPLHGKNAKPPEIYSMALDDSTSVVRALKRCRLLASTCASAARPSHMQSTKTRGFGSALFPQRQDGGFRAVRERHLGANDDHVRDACQLQLGDCQLDHLRHTPR